MVSNMNEITSSKKFIIGIGTGRCGTMSLARFLSQCKGVFVDHERREGGWVLPWEFNRKLADGKIEMLKKLYGEIVGDVAFYYLNYIRYFFEKLPNLKVIVMKRDREETILSYLKKTEGRNHWIENPEKYGWRVDSTWDKAYPKFETKDKKEAIGKYWDLYYQKVELLKKEFPEKILEVNLEDFNKKETQDEIYNFVGVLPEKRVYGIVHLNK